MIATKDTLQSNVAAWAVGRASTVLRDGPQQFDAVCIWVAAEAKEHFHGVKRRNIRRVLLDAASRGLLGATWRWRAGEAAICPCTVWIQPKAASGCQIVNGGAE